jgi:very-short-patch-repair endonuclease
MNTAGGAEDLSATIVSFYPTARESTELAMMHVTSGREVATLTTTAVSRGTMPLSQGEEEFALHCQIYRLDPVREYQFHPTRRWRVDFAWPDRKVAVEIEGSVHRIKGRFARDIEKYNALARNGWIVLRYSAKMVHAGTAIDEVMGVLADHLALRSV